MDRACLWGATLLGVGYVPKIPGTAASLLTLPAVYVLYGAGPWVYLAVTIVVTAVAIPVCDRASRILNHPDPSVIVLDEAAGMLIASAPGLLIAPSPAGLCVNLALSFIFFRLFDIWKPGWIGRLQSIPGGMGIVLDDVLAGVAAAVSVWVFHSLGRVLLGPNVI